jgi:hypothetical protein
MATMTETPEAAVSLTKPSHDYHANAHVLSGDLQRPIEQKIEQHAPVKLTDRRGGHLTRITEDVSIEGLISFTKGHTRVSGARSLKNNGWVTLSTSILEGLNVFEIITADRVVSQVSTNHPYKDGHVPHVTFLGSQFTNVQVSGFPLTLNVNLGICGDKPANDRSYFRDLKFLNGVKAQAQKIARAAGLPKEIKDRYDNEITYIDQLISTSDADDRGCHEPITCSLVQSIGAIPIPGVQTYGHVLVIPDFGTVSLGEIEVGEKMYEGSDRPNVYFELTGVNMTLGCVGHGTAAAATATANGAHKP